MEETKWRFLTCDLTGTEWKERSEQLADAVRELDEHDARAKTIRTELAERSKELRQAATKLSSAVSSRQEERRVECQWVPFLLERKMRLVRQDTMDIVTERAMTDDEEQNERQGVLFQLHPTANFAAAGVGE